MMRQIPHLFAKYYEKDINMMKIDFLKKSKTEPELLQNKENATHLFPFKHLPCSDNSENRNNRNLLQHEHYHS